MDGLPELSYNKSCNPPKILPKPRCQEDPIRVYIGADIEEITGVTHLDETKQGREGYRVVREQLTADVMRFLLFAVYTFGASLWLQQLKFPA